MTKTTIETLFRRYRDGHDTSALAEVYDRAAPQLIGLAKRFQGTASDGQDLLQETFLVALQKPEAWDESRPLLPWLLGILAHRALNGLRADAKHRSDAQVEVESGNGPEEAASAAEFQVDLQRAIDGLPAGLAAVVRGALLDGQRPSELAVSLGLAPGTVRQRLFRGMSSLRWQLRAWALALFALFGFSWRPSSARRRFVLEQAQARSRDAGRAKALAPAGSGLKAAACFGLLALVGGLVVWGPWAAKPEDVGRESGLQPLARWQQPLLEENAKLAPVALEDRAHELPVSTRQLEVEVRHRETKEPVADCEVSFMVRGKDGKSTHKSRSDADGQLILALAIDSTWVHMTARPTAITAGGELKSNPELLQGLQTIWVDGGGAISGRVVDGNGAPMSGALVQVWCGGLGDSPATREVVSDGAGSFRVEHIGPFFTLLAKAPGYVCDRGLHGTITADDDFQDHEILLSPATPLNGTVLRPDGSPAVSARIFSRKEYYQANEWNSTCSPTVGWRQGYPVDEVSDAMGRFSLANVPFRDWGHYFTVELSPFLVFQPEGRPWRDGVVIQLQEGRELAGRVVSSNGDPIPGATIGFTSDSQEKSTSGRMAKSDEEGHFFLEGIAPESDGKQRNTDSLVVFAPSYAIRILQPAPSWVPGQMPIPVVLETESTLEGRIVDENGEGMAKCTVRIAESRMAKGASVSRNPLNWYQLDYVDTDASGRFRFKHVYPGEFEMRINTRSKRYGRVERTVTSGGGPLEITLAPKEGLWVQWMVNAVDGLTGESIPSGTLRGNWNRAGSGEFFTDPWRRDQWSEASLAGEYSLTVEAPGYVALDLEEAIFAGGKKSLDVTLYPERSLLVRVLDGQGVPVVGGVCTGHDSFGNELKFRTGHMAVSRWTYRQEVAQIHGLPACEVTLLFETDQGSRELVIDLKEPREGVQEIQLLGPEPIEGRVFFLTAPPGTDSTLLKKQLDALYGTGGDRARVNNWRELLLQGWRLPRMGFTAELRSEAGKRLASCTYKRQNPDDGSAETMVMDTSRYRFSLTSGTGSHFNPKRFGPDLPSMGFTSHGDSCELQVESEHYQAVFDTWVPGEGPEHSFHVVVLIAK